MSEFASNMYDGVFEGTHVVVMGGGRGIGLNLAAAFAAAGADVVVTDISPTVVESAQNLEQASGLKLRGIQCDATSDESVRGLFESIGKEWKSLDVLVNNAGIIQINELENTSSEDFKKVVDVNTVAQFIATREALPLLKAAKGAVINAASGQARQGFIYTPSYAASKMGVVGLTQSLAKELAKYGIRVNAYCPGIVPTDMWSYNDREWGKRLGDYQPGELMQEWIDDIPIGRGATEQDVANAILFLASDAASYITGQALNVDGGMFMN